MELVLHRSYFEKGTNGALFLNNKFLCFTIELPCTAENRSESCIPKFTYELEARYSKKFGNHLLVKNVFQRNMVLIRTAHYANEDLRHGIAPVMNLTGIGRGSDSATAMQKVLSLCHQAFERKELVLLTIKECLR